MQDFFDGNTGDAVGYRDGILVGGASLMQTSCKAVSRNWKVWMVTSAIWFCILILALLWRPLFPAEPAQKAIRYRR